VQEKSFVTTAISSFSPDGIKFKLLTSFIFTNRSGRVKHTPCRCQVLQLCLKRTGDIRASTWWL
jgi:hypothetical protein